MVVGSSPRTWEVTDVSQDLPDTQQVACWNGMKGIVHPEQALM